MNTIYVILTEEYYGGYLMVTLSCEDAICQACQLIEKHNGRLDVVIKRFNLIDGKYVDGGFVPFDYTPGQ